MIFWLWYKCGKLINDPDIKCKANEVCTICDVPLHLEFPLYIYWLNMIINSIKSSKLRFHWVSNVDNKTLGISCKWEKHISYFINWDVDILRSHSIQEIRRWIWNYDRNLQWRALQAICVVTWNSEKKVSKMTRICWFYCYLKSCGDCYKARVPSKSCCNSISFNIKQIELNKLLSLHYNCDCAGRLCIPIWWSVSSWCYFIKDYDTNFWIGWKISLYFEFVYYSWWIRIYFYMW